MNETKKAQSKRRLLAHIGRGRNRAITGKVLAQMIGSDAVGQDRRLRVFVAELIEEGHPIASTTESPAGFFIANSPQEVNQYAQTLRKRLVKDAIRRRDFLRASREILQPEQLEMKV